MNRDPFLTERLFCPGPTPVPLSAHLAAMASSVYHRSEEFYKIFRECREGLCPIFGLTPEHAPLILTCSGSGSMEAAVVNFTDEKDEVLVINAGKFGERWEKLASKYRCQVEGLTVEWGQIPDLSAIEERLKSKRALTAVFFQANETSTGVQLPVAKIAALVRRYFPEALVIADAISSLVAHDMDMQGWGVDVVVAGSQKGFGIPPGLAFVGVAPRAWQKLSKRPRFYFDLKKEKDEQDKGSGAWTTATTLVQSLHQALIRINSVGAKQVAVLHAERTAAVQNAATALGLKLFAKAGPSHALTSIEVPAGIDGKALLKRLHKNYGFIFAGGQDQLVGKILRFSHLGFLDRFDLISGVAALEFALHDLGYKGAVLGAGVSAAMKTFADKSSGAL